MKHKWNEGPAVLSVTQVLAGWCVFSGEGNTAVGREEVGSTGYCRIGFVEVGVEMVERVERPDCLTSSFYFVLSGTTKPLGVVWMSSTTLEYSSGNLSILPVSTTSKQKVGFEERTWMEGSWRLGHFGS